jgi:two-component system sensor histidine kinase PilS (NtrC family)
MNTPLPRAGRDRHQEQSGALTWQPLHYFNIYRLILAGLFVTLFFAKPNLDIFGEHSPWLFGTVSLLYLLFALLSGFFSRLRQPSFRIQALTNAMVDIGAIVLLMHASGGIESGLSVLLVITIAGASLLLSGRAVIGIAAIATIMLLTEQAYAHIFRTFDIEPAQAGILGATFFATAWLGHMIANRIRASESLAAQRGVDLANMEQLNEYIIQHLQSGILVVDKDEEIRLMNESAWYLLGMPNTGNKRALAAASTELTQRLREWRRDNLNEPLPFRAGPGGADILPRFAGLGSNEEIGTVMFLEDASVMSQRAQQMKLASLGRLTASIAHEIRNPLGAISHAEQLLRESPALDKGDRRLIEIIRDQSSRVNTIIENVLQLSRRERSRPETFRLLEWLEDFIGTFIRDHHVEAEQISVDIKPADVEVYMDASHLYQVVSNLCENALRYGVRPGETARIDLLGGITVESRGPFLDIIDHGPGIGAEASQQIFEPFYTSASSGTGLGLYIARELCEFNQAQLRHISVPNGGSCFRISFADPRRQAL